MGFFSHDAVPTTASGISIENVHGDVPEFKRVYTKRLDSRASIKVEMKMFLNDLFQTGELTQPNGRWVMFDPDAIADKILDPVLVPLVQQCVDEIHAIDKTWRANENNEYTDKHGDTWRKVARS